jgi:hypothetical protein
MAEGLPELPDQKQSEGKGYVFTNDLAHNNSYTDKGGSKRD